MPYHLYARPLPEDIPADADESPGRLFDWVLLDASGEQQANGERESRDQIEQALSRNSLESVRLIGLIPGDQALFCFADIPAKQARYIRQALPFAVEEQLAQDIESVHLALGKQDGTGYRVAAVDHLRMAYWRNLYDDWEDVHLEALYPDASLLPVNDHDWTICLTDSEALVANKRGEWLTMRPENLPVFAQTLAVPSEEEVVAEVSIGIFATDAWSTDNEELMSHLTATPRLAVRRQKLEGSVVELLGHAHHHHLSDPINLCQAGYSAISSEASPLKAWRPAIAIAAIWFVLLTGGRLPRACITSNKPLTFSSRPWPFIGKRFRKIVAPALQM